MKVILVNQRRGLTRTFVIKGWLQGLLSLCLLVAPVALGCLGYQLSVQAGDQAYAQQAPAKADVLDLATQVLAVPARAAEAESSWPPSLLSGTAPSRFVESPEAAILPAPFCYPHGRIVDPATYQHTCLG